MQTKPAHPPSPELIFDILSAPQRTGVLKGAIELEVFTAIAEGAITVEALAEKCHASSAAFVFWRMPWL